MWLVSNNVEILIHFQLTFRWNLALHYFQLYNVLIINYSIEWIKKRDWPIQLELLLELRTVFCILIEFDLVFLPIILRVTVSPAATKKVLSIFSEVAEIFEGVCKWGFNHAIWQKFYRVIKRGKN